MSIELPLLQSLGKLPLSSSKRSPQSFLQLTHQIPNGGFGKLNQKICRNIFAGKIELKNFWGGVFVVKSFNLHTQFDQFGYLQITKASAAVYHSSDESNGRNYKGEMNELLNLSINLPDEGNQSKEFESGFAAGTDILAGNIFSRNLELKQLAKSIMPVGSTKSNANFQFEVEESIFRTVATAEHPVSDDSSKKNGAEMKLADMSIKVEDSEVGLNGGLEIEDGDDQGGNGHGGNGKSEKNGGFGGSEGGDHGLLRGLEWWWWWQWQRAHKRSHKGLRWGRGEPLYLADSIAQVVAAETMISLKPAMSVAVELYRVLALDQIVALVCYLLIMPFIFPFFLESNDEVSQGLYMTIGACVGVLLEVFLLALIWWAWRCWRNCDQQDDNANDSDDDNAAPTMPELGFVIPGYEENQL